jgi:hypothetical protein
VRITGGDPERLEVAARIAAEVGLEVWFSPFTCDLTDAEMLALLADCAERAERLRRAGAEVVFVAGAEISLLNRGFLPGETLGERVELLNDFPRLRSSLAQVPARVNDFLARAVWDAAITVRPEDASLDQAERFPLCQPEPLRALFQDAGLRSVAVRAIDIPTVFRDFDDYWLPFLGKQGAAPTYLASLDDAAREQIRERLQARLPAADGSIALTARAWAVQGTV